MCSESIQSGLEFRSLDLGESSDQSINRNEIEEQKDFITPKADYLKFAFSKNGSRALQSALARIDSKIINSIYNELKGNFASLMIHPYGNYFCQRFFEFLDQRQKLEFLKEVKTQFYLRSKVI